MSVNMPPFPGPWRVWSVYRGLAPAEDWLSGAELGPAPLGLGNPGSRDRTGAVIYMQNLLNCDEEKKMNDTKVIINSVNGDLCANGTLSSSFSLK